MATTKTREDNDLAQVAQKEGPGKHEIPLPSHIRGESYLGDETKFVPDMVRVIVRDDGSIRTAFPYFSGAPN